MKFGLGILVLFIAQITFGQEYEVRITKITDEQGVDVPSTFGIAEDPLGFIWFGTVGGLYRYDGYRMKVFRNIEGDSTSLSSNTIRALLVDKKRNKIYVGTQLGGLNVYDINTQRFTHYINDKNKSNSKGNNSIWSLMLDKEGILWVGMENTVLNKFNPDNKQFYNVELQNTDPEKLKGSSTVRMLHQDVEGNIWVGTDNHGLYMIDNQGKQKQFYEDHNNPKSIKNNFIISACNDADSNLWIATFGAGIARYKKESKEFEHPTNHRESNLGPISGLAYSIISDSTNNLWVGTEYGLSFINSSTFEAVHHVQNAASKYGLTDNRIRKLFRDSNGIIWVGTEAGVDKIVQQKNFVSYKNKIDNTNSLPNGIVRSIYKDSESILWVGLIDNGLVSYNYKTKKYTHYIDSKNINGNIICYQVSAIFEDSEGTFWIADWEKGLLKFNRKTKQYTPVLNSTMVKQKLLDNRIQTIREEKPGILWLGTETGIARFDFKEWKVDHLVHESDNDNTLSGNSVQAQAFEIDKSGNLWIGTWANGLNYVEILNDNPLQYKVNRFQKTNTKQWLSNNNVISLHLQNDSILWIGTFGGGLSKLNIKTNSLRHFDIEHGLPNNIIFSIISGMDNELWLSTDYGISKFNTQTYEFVNFDEADGLQDEHFFWGAAFQSTDKQVFFGGVSGLNSFYPQRVHYKTSKSRLLITDIRVNNHQFKANDPVEYMENISLDYTENNLTFDFSILDFSEAQKSKFMVQLEGLDNDMRFVGNKRSINYTNLKHGNYTLNIVALDRHKANVIDSAKLNIHIETPIWLKWWAVLIEILLVLAVVYALYSIRIRLLLAQKRKLSLKVKERTSVILEKNAILAQQNEEILAQKEELAKKNEQLSDALNKLSAAKEKVIQAEKMASLGVLAAGVAHEINNPLNYIKGGVVGIEMHLNEANCAFSNDTKTFLDAIKEGVSRAVAIVAGLNQFSRSSESQNEVCDIKLVIDNCLAILSGQLKGRVSINNSIGSESVIKVKGNSGKLHQAFLSILSNAEQAIEKKGTIAIGAKYFNKTIQIKISDNGIGIKKENLKRITEPFFTTKDPGKGTGLGLSITYRIIEEHKGQLLFESEHGRGTTVKVILPMSE